MNSVNHLSIILDGNKRFAKKSNITIMDAYSLGIDNVLKISNKLIEKKIKYFSVFTLSTENLQRKSVKVLFNSISHKFSSFLEKIKNDKFIKIQVIGERNNLPANLIDLINEAENSTINNQKLTLIIAFNYGFKTELKSVLKRGVDELKINNNNLDKIDFRNLFYLGHIPDPDILIRTGGFKRLSNYLMYNLCYTELFFTKTLWPDFNYNELEKIIIDFSKIKRNYGL